MKASYQSVRIKGSSSQSMEPDQMEMRAKQVEDKRTRNDAEDLNDRATGKYQDIRAYNSEIQERSH